ncbi:CPBP family intramembrane glutamic endopeptidase [Halobaculum sp. MBLA0147]|uniref:CPBP family intramembrane glutamic endopeptidase n=1 Tax=Halobaculum sp. MBLA0147 TaxID=3079934 RepID=UPI003526AF02
MSTRIGTRVRSIGQSAPATTYFVLALALSWSVWVPSLLAGVEAGVVVGAFGPAVAAAIVTRLRGDSVRAWLRSVLDPRTDLRWYLVALGLPAVWAVAIVGGLSLWTGSADWSVLVGLPPQIPSALVATTLLYGGNEEFGWRGFALPVLQERTDAATASVVVGVVWTVWHIPMFLLGVDSYGSVVVLPAYAVVVVGVSVVFTWLYNESGPSILPVMLCHGMFNVVMDPAAAAGTTSTALRYLSQTVPIWVTALVALAVYGRTRVAGSLVDTRSWRDAVDGGEHA